MDTRKVKHTRSKSKRFLLLTIIFVLIAILVTFSIGYIKLMPNKEQMVVDALPENQIFLNHKITPYSAVVEGEEVKLPLSFLNDVLIDNPIYFEEATETIVLTTANKVMRYQTASLDALVNEKPVLLNIKTDIIDGEVYISSDLINEWYQIQTTVLDSAVIHVYSEDQQLQMADVIEEEGTFLRSDMTVKSPYFELIPFNSTLYIIDLNEEAGWVTVQTKEGHSGYVQKKHISLQEPIAIKLSGTEPSKFVPPSLEGKKINLTWEAIYNRQPNLAKMPSLDGVNVVSPTWFELINDKGTIQGKATHEYMKWAHDNGFHVWALFSNGFEPDWTTKVLSSVETRFDMIKQLVVFAQTYKFEGINIDFENVYTADKENLVQFVRELTPIMHEMGVSISIDVTPKSNSEMWSAFLDRKSLGQIVDYMMVMTYDEHWAASPVAGSVASLPWVDRSIKRIIEEDGVPASKLILGIPLYTRVWTEAPQEDGSIKVSSKAIGMETAEKIIADKQLTKQYLDDIGQHYIEYEEADGKKRIWLEDEVSLQNRIEIVHKYELGGIATWSRSFQKPSIWPVMDEALQK